MIEDFSSQTGGRSLKEAAEVIAAGHPPIANKVALLDFDGTLYPFGYLFDYPQPFHWAIQAIKAYQQHGYRVYIFTSRVSPTWLASVNQTAEEHIEYITNILRRDGVTVSGITCEKIPCEFYIDDKAIQFKGDWLDILDKTLGKNAVII